MEDDTDPYEFPNFIFLGDADGGGASSRLAVADISYRKKRLDSGTQNWAKIIEMLANPRTHGVLAKLTNRVIKRMVQPEYEEVREKLGRAIARIPHIVFIHESFFLPSKPAESETEKEEGWFDDWDGDSYFEPLPSDAVALVQDLLTRNEIEVVPYRHNIEIDVMASDFVEQHQRNVLFRFYVPKNKLWARETETILALFTDYLTSSAGVEIKRSSHSTPIGTVYEFCGAEGVSTAGVSDQFENFSQVMDLCIKDPGEAERRLVAMGSSKEEARDVVDRYTKQLRRLSSDMRQEREKAVLRIRHRLEDEILEIATDAELTTVLEVVSLIVPEGQPLVAALGMGTRTLPSSGGVTINLRPQIIHRVEGIVAQELSGTVNMNPGALQLLELIETYGGHQTQQLRSAVFELEDPATAPATQLSAKARLKAFMFGLAKRVGEKAIDGAGDVLLTYLKMKLGLD